PEGSGTIDYGNAKPMPAPSIPAPAQPTTPPIPTIPGGIMGQPGASPGSSGTGEQTPQVLVPPKR
ncbi:MAG: hypothetical protein M3361_19715, partial [Candidatus Tectomicrobia bacterium]|nr:hypothetical protein [Candidatus Tectomicrobia bacterium]